MANIQVVRLISGEELLCDLTYKNGEYEIKNPVRIVMNVNKTNPSQVSFGFVDWLPYADLKDGITINKDHIVFVTRPASEFVAQYTQLFGGIVAPPKPKLFVPN
jgi:hypothetical protein